VGSAVYRRIFNHDQKRELWFAAGGRCVICRARLGPDWQADHIMPWSKGGLTIVENGQALCRTCNAWKSARALTVDE
jgi:5-methylcytosine-specific restriction endonuclease McrA